VLRAPSNPLITIDRAKHFVGETIELPSVVKNVTGNGFKVVTDIGPQLNHSEPPGSDALDELVLVELPGQDEFA
jgi:hypothetical protein